MFTPTSHKKRGAGRRQEVAESIEDAWMDMDRQIKELKGHEQAEGPEPEATNRCAEDYNYKKELSIAKEGIDIGRLYTVGTNEEVFGVPLETMVGVVRRTKLDLTVIRPDCDSPDSNGKPYVSKEMETEVNKENLKPVIVDQDSKPDRSSDCGNSDLGQKPFVGVGDIHKRKLDDHPSLDSSGKRRKA